MQKLAYKFTLEEAYAYMGLPYGASPEEVKDKYRYLAREYHPDHHPELGADEEMIKKLNRAKEVIDSGKGDAPASRVEPTRPTRDYSGESGYEDYVYTYDPQPSADYSAVDVMIFAETILERGLTVVFHRSKVQFIPMGIYRDRVYSRSIGSARSPQNMPLDTDVEKLNQSLLNFGLDKRRILDITVKQNEAWIIWELKERRGYQCISFERPKEKKKKAPGEGMTKKIFYKYMQSKDFGILMENRKYEYWGPRGETRRMGMFIRRSKSIGGVRLIKRRESSDGIKDINMVVNVDGREFFLSTLTTEILDRWVERVQRSSEQ